MSSLPQPIHRDYGDTTTDNDRDEQRTLRNVEDGGYWRRIAGAVVTDDTLPDLAEWER